MPDISVALVLADGETTARCFDDVILLKNDRHDRLNKISGLSRSPYDHTLYLDNDTRLYADITALFGLLERFDIGMAHAPASRASLRFLSERGLIPRPYIPECFPMFNSGVILYKKSRRMDDLTSVWRDSFQELLVKGGKPLLDQPALRAAIYHSDLRIATLPSEYNCRFMLPGGLGGPVQVLHGRRWNLEQIGETLNVRGDDSRAHIPVGRSVFVVYLGDRFRNIFLRLTQLALSDLWARLRSRMFHRAPKRGSEG